jgi:serine/threonine-protein kinase RsbW
MEGKAVKPSERRELTVRADLAEVDRVRAFLRDHLRDLALGEEDALKVELSLHEILVNIVLYAYPQAPGEMTVRISGEPGTLVLEIRDSGVPFDPAGRPPPDLDEKIRRGSRGGLGVYLFKTLMDGFSYRREGGENVLTIRKAL